MFGGNYFVCTFALSARGRLVDTFHGKARALGSGFFLFVLAGPDAGAHQPGEKTAVG